MSLFVRMGLGAALKLMTDAAAPMMETPLSRRSIYSVRGGFMYGFRFSADEAVAEEAVAGFSRALVTLWFFDDPCRGNIFDDVSK